MKKIILIKGKKREIELKGSFNEGFAIYIADETKSGLIGDLDIYLDDDIEFHQKFINTMIDIKEFINLGFTTTLSAYDFTKREQLYKFLEEKGTFKNYKDLLEKYSK